MEYKVCKSKVHKIQKGAYTSILWERDAKTKKACTDTIKKRVRATVRIGVDYEHLSNVKEARQNGSKPTESSGLVWGSWSEFPYFIQHTAKNGVTSTYLRAYLGKGANTTTEWYLNGKKVEKSDISHLLLASENKDNGLDEEKPVALNVSDILAIG